jgi:hypothetical protein
MLRYRNQYRVVAEFDRVKLQPVNKEEDLYIYCSNKGQIYRFNQDTLVYYRDGVLSSRLLEKLDELKINYENKTQSEVLIYFNEKDLDKLVDVFGIRTSGSSISPYSQKNLKLFKWFRNNVYTYRKQGLLQENKRELTDEEREVLRQRMIMAREKRNSK